MALDKKLIHFKTWNNFISDNGVKGNYTTPSSGTAGSGSALYGQIKETSIVFIQDVQKIWTHGQLYDCSSPDLSEFLTAEDLSTLNDFMNNSSVSKNGETLTVKINNSTQSLTNTWRSISDKIDGTSSTISASEKAVKAAYDLAASKTSNTGTVTSVTPGTGLTGESSDAAITTSGTINLKTAKTDEIGGIKVASVGTAASGANTTINANKFAVHIDSNGLGYIAIPKYSNNSGDITGVTAGNGLTGGATSGNATLNVGQGNGITVSADAVSHADTSELEGAYGQSSDVTQSAKNTASFVVPQITVDGFGHVTNITNKTITVTDTDTTYSSLKNPNALTFGSKSYDGSSAQEITAADLGLSSALKYCGVTTTVLSDGANTNPIKINNANYTATTGCVVFYGDKEYVFNGSTWEELGYARTITLNTVNTGGPSATSTVASSAHTHSITMPTASFSGNSVTSGKASSNTTSVATAAHTHVTDEEIDHSHSFSASVNLSGTTGTTDIPTDSSTTDDKKTTVASSNHTHSISGNTGSGGASHSHSVSGTTNGASAYTHDHGAVGSFTGSSSTSSAPVDAATTNDKKVSVGSSSHTHSFSGATTSSSGKSHNHSFTPSGSVTSSFTGTKGTTENNSANTSVATAVHTHALSITTASFSGNTNNTGAASSNTSNVASTTHTHSVTGTINSGGASHSHTYDKATGLSVSISNGCATISLSSSSVNTGSTTASHTHTFTGSASAPADNTTNKISVPSTSHTHSFTPTGSISVAGSANAPADNTTNKVNVASSTHAHDFTPSGSVSSSFSGTEGTTGNTNTSHTHTVSATTGAPSATTEVASTAHKHTLTPNGSISVTVNSGGVDHTHQYSSTSGKTTASHTHSVSFTSGAPSETAEVASTIHKHSFTPSGSISISGNTGSAGAHSHEVNATVNNTTNRVSVPNTNHTHSVTATGSVSFSSTTVTSGTPSATTKVGGENHTHSVTPTGSIS